MKFYINKEEISIVKSSIATLYLLSAQLKVDDRFITLDMTENTKDNKLYLSMLIENDILDDDNKLYANFLIYDHELKQHIHNTGVLDCIKRTRENMNEIFGIGDTHSQCPKILKILGCTSYMLVFLVEMSSGEKVILKATKCSDKLLKKLWDNEIEISKHLNGCEYSMQHLSNCSIGEHDYIVYKFFSDTTIHKYLLDASELKRKNFIARVIPNIFKGLNDIIDRGVIHRDIKPENIICNDDGQIHFIDFDLSCFVDDLSKTVRSNGSTEYRDPTFTETKTQPTKEECICNDLWSIGVTLFNMTGMIHKDFTHEFKTPSSYVENYSDKLKRFDERLKYFFGEFDISTLLTFKARINGLKYKTPAKKWMLSRNNQYWFYEPTYNDTLKLEKFYKSFNYECSNNNVVSIEYDMQGNTFLNVSINSDLINVSKSKNGLRFGHSFIYDIIDIRNSLDRVTDGYIREGNINYSDYSDVTFFFYEGFKST